MTVNLYNTLTRKKEPFVPLDQDNIRIYVCGPTVYDYAHIGNARPVIVFDTLFRLLRHIYGAQHVTYVRNITDVDDKINARAAEENVDIRSLTERTNEQFQKDMAALGNLAPTVQPRATEHIAQMIALIEQLIERGHAYAAEGHALFHVPSMANYGALSNRSLEEMQAGARVEVAPYKKDPMDFVLWKPSSDDEPGWESPWGRGRPGWHIECSAMSKEHLGEVFDIHGGGIDLVFPHHENEIAQSCCAHGTQKMAQVWMHNGFLQVEGEKMSKSLGNFFTVHELLETERFGGKSWSGDAIRLAMLMTHYRKPIDWTVSGLEMATTMLNGWKQHLLDLGLSFQKGNEGIYSQLQPSDGVIEQLKNDLNTPGARAELDKLAKQKTIEAGKSLFANLVFLGLTSVKDMADFEKHSAASDDAENNEIDELVAARSAAKQEKNWAEADRIRDELTAQGVVLKDNPDGTTSWTLKR